MSHECTHIPGMHTGIYMHTSIHSYLVRVDLCIHTCIFRIVVNINVLKNVQELFRTNKTASVRIPLFPRTAC